MYHKNIFPHLFANIIKKMKSELCFADSFQSAAEFMDMGPEDALGEDAEKPAVLAAHLPERSQFAKKKRAVRLAGRCEVDAEISSVENDRQSRAPRRRYFGS